MTLQPGQLGQPIQLRQRGFTLIELLVAMAIGAIVSMIIAATFQAVLVGGMRADTVVDSQDSARNALTLMSNDIEASGFMISGASGVNQCKTILTYNKNDTVSPASVLYPVMATDQTVTGTVPDSTIAFGYTSPATKATEAITLTYNNAFGGSSSIGGNFSTVAESTNGTDNAASLFLTDASGFSDGEIDLLVLPTLGVCIRLQITNIGGANNIVHNSGKSDLNPPKGFSSFNSYLPRPINQNDLWRAKVQGMSGTNAEDGMQRVTYSIRNVNGVPTLYRTVINATGTVLTDTAIANNVVYLRALFAPIQPDGSLSAYVPWSTIVANKQESNVAAVQLALVVQRKNVGNRGGLPTSIPVLDTTYPAATGFEYTVYGQMIYLNNVAWNQ